ncbi:hypothetical protein [Clostridium scatologenes]|uniref:Uncharacterized protein n=1 Tax=Clostridium scatologenes TaxID=1548 RepID=A0A0E3K1P0_CLOSL|nr:hypothetical protein [Clostridium scatologenes]AKA70152.1 hypothetical protein CSCA_3027 [Clostridium scatologenes]
MFGRKFKDEVLEDIFSEYGMSFNVKMKMFNLVYKDIEEKYVDLLRKSKLNIYKEKSRLESRKCYIESNVNACNAALLVLGITMLLTYIIDFYKYDICMKTIATIIYVVIILFTMKYTTKDLKKSMIYGVAIRVLEGIEKDPKRFQLKINTSIDVGVDLEEVAATQSNEVIEKLDIINETINKVDKKVEDLKKFHDIK